MVAILSQRLTRHESGCWFLAAAIPSRCSIASTSILRVTSRNQTIQVSERAVILVNCVNHHSGQSLNEDRMHTVAGFPAPVRVVYPATNPLPMHGAPACSQNVCPARCRCPNGAGSHAYAPSRYPPSHHRASVVATTPAGGQRGALVFRPNPRRVWPNDRTISCLSRLPYTPRAAVADCTSGRHMPRFGKAG